MSAQHAFRLTAKQTSTWPHGFVAILISLEWILLVINTTAIGLAVANTALNDRPLRLYSPSEWSISRYRHAPWPFQRTPDATATALDCINLVAPLVTSFVIATDCMLIHYARFFPLYALAAGALLAPGWLVATVCAALAGVAAEIQLQRGRSVQIAMTVFFGLVTLLYFVYVGVAVVGALRWRRERSGRRHAGVELSEASQKTSA